MTTTTEQYTEIFEQGQQAVRTAVEAWTQAARDLAGQLPTPAVTTADTAQAIDRVFDVAAKVLEAQRTFTKQLVTTTGTLTEQAARQAAGAGPAYAPRV